MAVLICTLLQGTKWASVILCILEGFHFVSCVSDKVMAAADGPTQLLEVCGQRLSRFLHDAEHKHLAWLREVEEQGLRMLDR